MSFKRNLVANYLGQGWSGIVGLVFVPIYIRYLGMEAYGLIGFFAMLQAAFALLDMGMAPTLNREMARFTAGAHSPQSIRDLLRSLELICLGVALFAACIVWECADVLAVHWLQAEKLPIVTMSQALSLMGVMASLRLVEGLYRGALLGLQKQVMFNGLNAILATVRAVGALGVLAWITPSIEAYFLWQAFISLVTVAVLALMTHCSLPVAVQSPRFSRVALADIGAFAGGMLGIALLSLLLTQVDKLLLSRLLTLEAFGHYALAATAASVLHLLIVPITQGIYPQLVEWHAGSDAGELATLYHQGAQLVTVATVPLALLIACFAEGVLLFWSGDVVLARDVAPILSLLVLGTLLNGLMHMPYHLQLAHGWTTLTLRTNLVAVALVVPVLMWIAPRQGAVGAAWVWLALNAGYVLIAVHFMHQRLLPGEKWRWYGADILLPGTGISAVMLLAYFLRPGMAAGRFAWLVFLVVTGTAATLAGALLASQMRARIFAFATRAHS